MSVSITRIAFAQKEYRLTSPVQDASVLTRHPLAEELIFNTLLRNETDAQAFGQAVLALRKQDRWTWACYVNKKNYTGIEVGQTITLVYPRYGFVNGKNFIVKRYRTDSNALYDELTLFGPQ